MKTITRALAACLSAILWLVITAPPAQAADKLNVLFVIADDLNCDLACYGHGMVQSPHIDKLAGRGLRFERAYCQYPLCCPSRASFMCGLYPDQTAIRSNGIYIRDRLPDVVTMSQMFRNQGYTSMRVGKIYHYGVPSAIGTDGHDDPDSWDKVINPRGRDKDDESQIFTLQPGQYGGTLSWLAAEGTDAEQTDGIGAGAAIEQLEAFASNKKPFFLAVGFYRPHTPYVAPKKYFDMYPPERIVVPTVPAGYAETLPKPAQATLAAKPDQIDLPDETARRAIQAYYASITFMDAQVGRVVDALDRLGLADNTVVLFTSDHGYHMGEHAYYQKQTLFENATHVPLIISVPGMKTAGQTTRSFAEMVDFYPTLAEVCELEAPGHVSGTSLASVLEDAAAKPRKTALTQLKSGYALRTNRYRYVEWGENGSEGAELYDRQTDPQEMTNLAGKPEQADTIVRLSKTLRGRVLKARQVPEGLTRHKVDAQSGTARKANRASATKETGK